jgi:hypothetical protein
MSASPAARAVELKNALNARAVSTHAKARAAQREKRGKEE